MQSPVPRVYGATFTQTTMDSGTMIPPMVNEIWTIDTPELCGLPLIKLDAHRPHAVHHAGNRLEHDGANSAGHLDTCLGPDAALAVRGTHTATFELLYTTPFRGKHCCPPFVNDWR
jgi:hypothetical protein